MSEMTPDEAREYLARFLYMEDWEFEKACGKALETIAAMTTEHDHGVVDWEQVDGRYEVYHRVRLVGEWQDAEPSEAAN